MSCRHKDHHNYQLLAHTWTVSGKKENFFVSYAVRGPMVVPNYGLQQDLTVNHSIKGSIHEPSPLNNRLRYNHLGPPTSGIL